MPAKENISSSVTALGIVMSFIRGAHLEPNKSKWISSMELNLAHHLMSYGLATLSSANWCLMQIVSSLPYAFAKHFFEYFVVPKYDERVRHRKEMIKHKVELALKEGAEQVIFLGAGYDIRGFSVAYNNPHVNVFELDTGLTHASKVKALCHLPKGLIDTPIKTKEVNSSTIIFNDNFYAINQSLSGNFEQQLIELGFSKDKKTIVIAEGLTIYLTEKENIDLLMRLKGLLSETSEVIISYSTSEFKLSSVQKEVQANESYHFTLSPSNIIKFLTPLGYQVSSQYIPLKECEPISDTYQEQPHEHYFVIKPISPEVNQQHTMLIDVPYYEMGQSNDDYSNSIALTN